MNIKIKWEIVDGFCIEGPVVNGNCLEIRVPFGLPEVVLFPGDDIVVPTGLRFPGLHEDFTIIPYHHTYINKNSDVFGCWNGKIKKDNFPILHFSIVLNKTQIFLHVINLGKTELIIKPGDLISIFEFVPLVHIDN